MKQKVVFENEKKVFRPNFGRILNATEFEPFSKGREVYRKYLNK